MSYTAKPAVLAHRDLVAELAGPFPVSFLLGLMDRLSGGNASYEGSLGGRGLYQIHPATAEALEYDPDLLWDPAANVEIAVELLSRRSAEIQERDPGIASERPEDLGFLTVAAYLYGPGKILPLVAPGVTSGQVFAALDPAIGQFAVDVFARALAYQNGNGTAIVPSQPGNGDQAAGAGSGSLWGPLLWIAGTMGVVAGVWFLVQDRGRRK